MIQNINHIQLQKASSFRGKAPVSFEPGCAKAILVENIIPYNLNPFRDEILSLKSILYFVPTALFGGVKSLSTNILSLMGQVKLTPKRNKIGTTCSDSSERSVKKNNKSTNLQILLILSKK